MPLHGSGKIVDISAKESLVRDFSEISSVNWRYVGARIVYLNELIKVSKFALPAKSEKDSVLTFITHANGNVFSRVVGIGRLTNGLPEIGECQFVEFRDSKATKIHVTREWHLMPSGDETAVLAKPIKALCRPDDFYINQTYRYRDGETRWDTNRHSYYVSTMQNEKGDSVPVLVIVHVTPDSLEVNNDNPFSGTSHVEIYVCEDYYGS